MGPRFRIGGTKKSGLVMLYCKPVQMRAGIAGLPGEPLLPLLEVSYKLRELHVLLPLFEEMERRKLIPEVFMWDRDRPKGTMGILFRVPEPDKALVLKIAKNIGPLTGRRYAEANAIASWHNIFTIAEAALDSNDMDTFHEALKYRGCATLVVYDASKKSKDSSKPIGEPMKAFIITEVLLGEPSHHE